MQSTIASMFKSTPKVLPRQPSRQLSSHSKPQLSMSGSRRDGLIPQLANSVAAPAAVPVSSAAASTEDQGEAAADEARKTLIEIQRNAALAFMEADVDGNKKVRAECSCAAGEMRIEACTATPDHYALCLTQTLTIRHGVCMCLLGVHANAFFRS